MREKLEEELQVHIVRVKACIHVWCVCTVLACAYVFVRVVCMHDYHIAASIKALALCIG